MVNGIVIKDIILFKITGIIDKIIINSKITYFNCRVCYGVFEINTIGIAVSGIHSIRVWHFSSFLKSFNDYTIAKKI